MSNNNLDANLDVNLSVQDERQWYSADELAELKLPGYPRSGRRIRDRVEKENWISKQVPSPGRTGFKAMYVPPANVLKLIAEKRLENSGGMQLNESPNTYQTRPEPVTQRAPETTSSAVNALDVERLLEAVKTVEGWFDDSQATMAIEKKAEMIHAVYTLLGEQSVNKEQVQRLVSLITEHSEAKPDPPDEPPSSIA